MNSIVIYKSKYGSTESYAKWIADELGCEAVDAKNMTQLFTAADFMPK